MRKIHLILLRHPNLIRQFVDWPDQQDYRQCLERSLQGSQLTHLFVRISEQLSLATLRLRGIYYPKCVQWHHYLDLQSPRGFDN